ncbi:MAG: serine/threonine-protein kinase [Gemmatimonadota bacterium]|nr:serine/threonine-protein kinase [Gemmatimonadota bacterium]
MADQPRSASSPSPESEALPEGLFAERYRVERVLGRGGMATVYAAEDVKHRRRVALKILHRDCRAALGGDRFLREIELTGNLQHPNILPMFDSGDADGMLYYVMPLVDGHSLRARMHEQGQLPFDEAIRIATDVAGALDYAHKRGVVHRDIKPENILLAGNHTFVADFGIAKAKDAAGEALTATGLLVGTPAYMSPEQASGERELDARSDIYALGCVVYEMLAGEPPFIGSSTQAVIAKRMAGAAPSVRTLRHTVPAHVERAINCALARSPADRFASAADFSDALRGARPGTRVSARHFRSPLAIAGAITVLLGLGAAAWAYMGRGTSPTDVNFLHAPLKRMPTSDSIAHGLYLRGRAQTDKRSATAVARGIELYQQAIARDSGFADAWAGLAKALQFSITWRYPVPNIARDSVVPLMVRASERALEADSNSTEAWMARAVVLRELDKTTNEDVLDALLHALRTDSSNADVWYAISAVWQNSLEHRRAIDALRRAVALNPRHTTALGFLGLNYMWLRNYDSALVWADSAKKIDPAAIFARQSRGLVLIMRRDWPQAETEYEAAIRLGRGPDQVHGWAGLAEVYFRRGDRHAADTIIAHALTLVDSKNPTVHDAAYLAWAFVATGHHDRALQILERYQPRKDMHFQLHLQRDPTFDPLRRERRFRALLARQNVPLH